MPDDLDAIAKATRAVFETREQSLVIGLTGRTGSGCSTVAKMLEMSRLADLARPDQPNPPSTHDDRKNRIVYDWLDIHWHPFARICVSDVIAAYALEDADAFQAYTKQLLQADLLPSKSGLLAATSRAVKQFSPIFPHLGTAPADEVKAAYDFYFRHLPVVAAELRSSIAAQYTKLFQAIGDNLRRSGRPFSDEVTPTRLFTIPERILDLIRLGERFNTLTGVRENYYVVDALRHPYEILHLRERLPRFYAVAITTDEDSRRKRLLAKEYREAEIVALDRKEYPDSSSNVKGYNRIISQDIQACISASDIYVSNPGAKREQDTRQLAAQVCRYVALMQHPGLVTPTQVERCMHTAWAARLNSGCISRQVGAVVTDKNYSVKAIGWNDVPRGQVPCILRYSRDLLKHTRDTQAFSVYEQGEPFKKELSRDRVIASARDAMEGRHLSYCFKSVFNRLSDDRNQVHTRALHAEENAFLQIAKYGGMGLEGGYLFTTSSPCELCAKKAYQLGIQTVYYVDPYPGISGDHVFGTVNAPKRELFSGVIGRAYHDLYSPILPYKDELAMLQLQAPQQERLPLS